MEIPGRVHDGVVIFDESSPLPEGAVVSVVYPAPAGSMQDARPVTEKRRIELPLVHCEQPGSIELTGQQIGEILDAEDAAPRR